MSMFEVIDRAIERMIEQQDAPTNPQDVEAKHSGCSFFSVDPDREGFGNCSQFKKSVRGDENACGSFETAGKKKGV